MSVFYNRLQLQPAEALSITDKFLKAPLRGAFKNLPTASVDQTRLKKGRRAKPRVGFYILFVAGLKANCCRFLISAKRCKL